MKVRKYIRQLYFAVEPLLFAPLGRVLRSSSTRAARSLVAQKFLEGTGLEIGAFASPTLVPLWAKVRYVDRVPAAHWKDEEEYAGIKVVDPDIIDDGALLSGVADSSVDWIVSCQMLEHVPNAMAALKNWVRVVKPRGVIVICIPDKRFTRDRARPTTSVEHFVRDFEEGPEWGAAEHYHDVGQNVLGLSGGDLDVYVAGAPEAIHFHVWDMWSFIRFLQCTNNYFGCPFDLLEVTLNHKEIIAVLKIKEDTPLCDAHGQSGSVPSAALAAVQS